MKNKKKVALLFLMLLITINTTKPMKPSSAISNYNDRERMAKLALDYFSNNIQKSLVKKAFWWLLPVLIQITLREAVMLMIDKKSPIEETELNVINNMIAVNQSIKNQIEYIKKSSGHKKYLKSMEQKYIDTCNKIIDIHNKYLDKYANRDQSD